MSGYYIEHGTPNSLNRRDYTQQAGAKKMLLKLWDDMHNWALVYNHTMAREMEEQRQELNDLNLIGVTSGSEFEWGFTDDHTRVTTLFRIGVQ